MVRRQKKKMPDAFRENAERMKRGEIAPKKRSSGTGKKSNKRGNKK